MTDEYGLTQAWPLILQLRSYNQNWTIIVKDLNIDLAFECGLHGTLAY